MAPVVLESVVILGMIKMLEFPKRKTYLDSIGF
jgi:hypothetical protein